jgi:hypothetical protein
VEETIMSRTLESPVSAPRLVTAAKAAMRAAARGFSALIAEHALALRAATQAALPRRQRADLRAMYTAPKAERRRAPAKDSFMARAFESLPVRRLATRLNVMALVAVLGLIALLAAQPLIGP